MDLFSLIAISCTAGVQEAGRMISDESANIWSVKLMLLYAMPYLISVMIMPLMNI